MRSISHASTNSTSTSTTSSTSRNQRNPAPLIFYPAYCNSASPTWSTWVKLSAHDIHHVLRPHPSPHATTTFARSSPDQTFYYLNHPIQFLQVVGVILALDDAQERFWHLTLDDGSGATLEVKCWKPAPAPKPQHGAPPTTTTKLAVDEDEMHCQSLVPTLEIGAVIQAKGTLTTFHGMRQLTLRRIAVARDTAAEVRLIDARTTTLETLLSKPWVVSPARQQALLREAQGDVQQDQTRAAHRREREERRVERERRHARQIVREYEREEGEREKAAAEAREAGVRLMRARARARARAGV